VNRSHLKKVFWPNLCVGASFQVLDILEYACGLKLGPALILNQNPFFEMASSKSRLTTENYLPKMATEAEIRSWIEHHIDFSKLKNKMQAMGQIMKHFGSAADGNAVKNILQQM
jgi:hypothetical protein